MKTMLGLVFMALVLAATPWREAIADETKLPTTAIQTDPDNFIEGNLYFLAYHELGHAFVSEFEFPVLGREEDAVDRLAIWMMTPVDGEQQPDYLVGAMRGWFMTAEQTALSDIDWWDDHGTDQQRGYQIACLLYGTDTEFFKGIADTVQLPEGRRETCVSDAADNDRSWDGLLWNHVRPPDAKDTPAKINVTYAKTTDYAGDADYFRKLGLLEDVAQMMETQYLFKPGITLEARECGEANAYWHADTRTLTMCYELVADFRDLATKLK